MHSALTDLQRRLSAEGLDTEHVVRAGEAMVEHLGAGDPGPWFAALERYVRQVTRREGISLWSVLHFVVGPLLPVVGVDLPAFERALAALGNLFVVREDSRLEQHGVRAAAEALAGRPAAFAIVVAGAEALLREGFDAGWFVQVLGPALAKAAPDDGAFAAQWQALLSFAQQVNRGDVHVGYPLSVGIAALLERADASAQPSPLLNWLAVLQPLALTARREAYALFEHSLPALASGSLSADDVADALRLALAMFDHGLHPTATLQQVYEPLQLDMATRLANAGVDPALVIGNGARCFAQLGWLDDAGDRLCRLAIELHRRSLRQLLFQDGLDVMPSIAQQGQAEAALELIEAMVARDLEPGVLMRWSLPRTWAQLRPDWALAELLAMARMLVELGIAPEPAVKCLVRPLVEMAERASDVRRASEAVVAFVPRLPTLDEDAHEQVFRALGELAEIGQSPQGFLDLLALFHGLCAAVPANQTALLPLCSVALPAAARAASGRPWVLAAALTSATRLVGEGRQDEAMVLLESGVGAAIALGPDDQAGFARMLALVEERYAELPPALAAPASTAASILAGTDVPRLSEALAIIAAASQRHGAALEAIASALPDLARMAEPMAGLGMLIDTVVAIAGEQPDAVELVAVAARSCRTAADGRSALQALARSLHDQPERRESLHRFARCAGVVAPASLASLLALVHAAYARCREPRLLGDLFVSAQNETDLRRMCEVLPPLLVEPGPGLLDGMHHAKALIGRCRSGWSRLVLPALATAKERAGSLLRVLAAIPSQYVEADEDLAVVQQLITQFGVRTIDIVANLLTPALARGVIPALAAHHETLLRYLREVGFADADVYARFVAILDAGEPHEVEPQIAALRAEVAAITDAIRSGEVSAAQRQHPMFGIALQRVFPPAVSATRQDYERLIARMPDRPQDVTAWFANGDRGSIELRVGGWQLGTDREGLDVFGWCERVLPTAATAQLPWPELGWRLLTAWTEDRLARAGCKHELVQQLLALLPPTSLPTAAYGSAGQILAIVQLASDRLASAVEQALVAAQAEDPARYERLVRAKLHPVPRVGPGLQKAIAAVLQAAAAGTVATAEAERRLRAQLQAFELPDAPLAVLRADPSLLQRLSPREVALEPGKEIGRVHAELVGQELAAMNEVVARVLEYRPSSEVLRLDAVVTKRSVHAPIGYCTGVCVAPDLDLWQTPGFLHLALFEGGVCRGGVHLLVVEEKGRRHLVLPGINPSLVLLEQVDASVLLAALLEYARGLASRAGLAGVWVPTAPVIHSNRAAIGQALRAMGLPTRRTVGHAFSHSPYAYHIDEVFVV
ncbi:MAG: hypothetical protein MUC36_03265 [Planctomycetes bacterium]|jgi:hypothetical protein|nr:hypothetical protein [Planctomycetota bacterium]